MNIDEIIRNKERLDAELLSALSTMEKKDAIFKIREQIEENQNACPHYSEKYNFERVNNICPYCGRKMVC